MMQSVVKDIKSWAFYGHWRQQLEIELCTQLMLLSAWNMFISSARHESLQVILDFIHIYPYGSLEHVYLFCSP